MRPTPGIVFDCEGDGLYPTKFHCLVAKDADGEYPTTDYSDYISFFNNSGIIVGQNIRRWDLPHLERVVGISYDKCRVVDTLALSWYLYPQRDKHGLESWGEEFGVPKPKVTDWKNLTTEEYIHRCTEDTKINWLLWSKQWKLLNKIYDSEEKIWEFLDYLDFKMKCAMLQEKSKWKVDLELARNTVRKLEDERESKTAELQLAMPKVPVRVIKSYPARPLKADGTLSAQGLKWKALLEDNNLPRDFREPIEVITGYDEPNAGSSHQIKEWLYSLGWKPQTFKYKKDNKAIPQVNQEFGKGICDSVKKLFVKEPKLEALDGLSVISHRLGLVRGFINDADDDGFVRAEIAGLTNTLRFKHSVVVNLPKVGKPWGEEIRGSLIARKGKILVGSDMASLEDRLKQHFLYKYDPEYVRKLMKPDYDPHIDLAIMGNMLTEQQGEDYKNGAKQYKPVRDIAKNGNYSCQYGAGPPKIALTTGISLEQAKIVHSAYWKLNWAIKAVVKDQRHKTVEGQMWLLNPINGFYYSLREVKDIFSTLVQGTAAYAFDIWVGYYLSQNEQLTGQFHDELVSEIDNTDEAKELARTQLTNAINWTNEFLSLDRELGIDIQFGLRYSNIH